MNKSWNSAPDCPVSERRVDEKAVRFAASLVLVLALSAFFLKAWWLSLLLLVDFALRSGLAPSYSPIGFGANRLVRSLGIAPKPVDAAPKAFAALCGVLFSAGLAICLWLQWPWFSLGFLLPFAFCAALEAFLGYCVGCRVYHLLRGMGILRN